MPTEAERIEELEKTVLELSKTVLVLVQHTTYNVVPGTAYLGVDLGVIEWAAGAYVLERAAKEGSNT